MMARFTGQPSRQPEHRLSLDFLLATIILSPLSFSIFAVTQASHRWMDRYIIEHPPQARSSETGKIR